MVRKTRYKPRSWHDYNKSLIERGSIFLWLDKEVIDNWQAVQIGSRGAPRKYSDLAILAILKMRYLFNLTLRAAQGFISSIFGLLDIDLPVPHYTTISRRLCKLDLDFKLPSSDEPISIAIDSSGLKVYGEGEWKVRMHGYGCRRTWRKFHLAIDVDTQLIHGVTVTTNDFKDSEVFETTISQIECEIEDVIGDGAYDSKDCYQVCDVKNIKPIFPPRINAVIHQHGNIKKEPLCRDQAVRMIRAIGRNGWKNETKYHRRSLVETAIFRFKKLFTANLKSRKFINQAKEVFIKSKILNIFNNLGLPQSIKVGY